MNSVGNITGKIAESGNPEVSKARSWGGRVVGALCSGWMAAAVIGAFSAVKINELGNQITSQNAAIANLTGNINQFGNQMALQNAIINDLTASFASIQQGQLQFQQDIDCALVSMQEKLNRTSVLAKDALSFSLPLATLAMDRDGTTDKVTENMVSSVVDVPETLESHKPVAAAHEEAQQLATGTTIVTPPAATVSSKVDSSKPDYISDFVSSFFSNLFSHSLAYEIGRNSVEEYGSQSWDSSSDYDFGD